MLACLLSFLSGAGALNIGTSLTHTHAHAHPSSLTDLHPQLPGSLLTLPLVTPAQELQQSLFLCCHVWHNQHRSSLCPTVCQWLWLFSLMVNSACSGSERLSQAIFNSSLAHRDLPLQHRQLCTSFHLKLIGQVKAWCYRRSEPDPRG